MNAVTDHVKNSRKRKAADQGESSRDETGRYTVTTIEDSFLSANKIVSQVDVNNAVSNFIVQGIHPLATVEQPAFIKLVSSKYYQNFSI